jgi:hypothetical protein
MNWWIARSERDVKQAAPLVLNMSGCAASALTSSSERPIHLHTAQERIV